MNRILSLLLAAAIGAQSEPAPDATVEVPTFANATCPIMGKKVSMPLFIDTAAGRFYVCCKPCFKKIRKNLEAAHKTGYPVIEPLDNEVCPVSGEPIGELAESVTLQGYRLNVCCAGCVDQARQNSQVTLTKVTRPEVDDVGNTACPITGEPVAPNAFVLIDGALVHLSSDKLVGAIKQDPAAVLAKARAIAGAQKPKPRHEHRSDMQPGGGEDRERQTGGGDK